MPLVRITVFENVRPEYCVVSAVPSAKPSKSMVIVAAATVDDETKSAVRYQLTSEPFERRRSDLV
jgi:hypothetical protein